MPKQLEQLTILAEHLLDGYRLLGTRYGLLSPMLFDMEVGKSRGSGKQWRGFVTIRDTLFLTCVQDIAKYSLDAYPDTPSIRNILRLMHKPLAIENLRARYVAQTTPFAEPETDPAILELMAHHLAGEVVQRGVEFDNCLKKLLVLWPEYGESNTLKKLATIRNKLTAHTELVRGADQYALVDIAALDIKWNDLKATMAEMRLLVELVGTLVRNSGFAWDAFDSLVADMASGFWTTPAALSATRHSEG